MENRKRILILIWYIIFNGYVVERSDSFNCTFDLGFCQWIKRTNANFKLAWGRQKSSSSKTGPNSDHTSGDGMYAYINSSNELANEKARLFTPWQTRGNYCLSFWYYMYGRDTDLLLVAVREDTIPWHGVFNMSKDQRKMWRFKTITFHRENRFKISIQGTIQNDSHDFGYIAVDDVKMFPDECPKYCSDPTPAFGKAVVGDIWEGSFVNISCSEGYDIKGNSSIVCQDSGKWSDTPSCQPVECSKPILTKDLLQPNGTTWYINQVIILACADGYNLRGNATITCKDSGNWTILPTCDYIEESDTSALIAVAVTVPLFAICILVITIVFVCRKRTLWCMEGDKAREHDMNRQTQHPNKTYGNFGLNTDPSTLDKSLEQDTEYAVTAKENTPEMKDVSYDTDKYGTGLRNNVDYDHMKTSFEPVLDNTYSHIQDNNNDFKTKPSNNSTDSYSYTNAAFQEIDDEYNHVNLERIKESGNQNVAINLYGEHESDYDHAKAGGCDPFILDLDEYSHLNTAVRGQGGNKSNGVPERKDEEKKAAYENVLQGDNDCLNQPTQTKHNGGYEEPVGSTPDYFVIDK